MEACVSVRAEKTRVPSLSFLCSHMTFALQKRSKGSLALVGLNALAIAVELKIATAVRAANATHTACFRILVAPF